jgi:hypothetical protein
MTDRPCEEIRLLDFETPPETIWMEKYVSVRSIQFCVITQSHFETSFIYSSQAVLV